MTTESQDQLNTIARRHAGYYVYTHTNFVAASRINASERSMSNWTRLAPETVVHAAGSVSLPRPNLHQEDRNNSRPYQHTGTILCVWSNT
jgi:hypothetical protein